MNQAGDEEGPARGWGCILKRTEVCLGGFRPASRISACRNLRYRDNRMGTAWKAWRCSMWRLLSHARVPVFIPTGRSLQG